MGSDCEEVLTEELNRQTSRGIEYQHQKGLITHNDN